MEISTAAPGSSSVATKIDQEDTAAAAPSLHTPLPSDANENELEEAAEPQSKGTTKVDKGKDSDHKKHGVMSLPAEIRETYAFQSSTSGRRQLPISY